MTQKERMLAGLPYKAWLDGLSEERMACRRKLHAFNLLPPDEEEQAQRLLLEHRGGGQLLCQLQPHHSGRG